MNYRLTGRRAVVGGASKGLGLACAQVLAQEGCAVALVARSAANLEAARRTFPDPAQVLLVEADLGTADGVARCAGQVEAWGAVDILVNNTGGPPPGGSLAHDEAAWRQAGESLLFYVKRMCERFLPGMRQRRWGRIITITSRTVKEPADNLVLSNVFRTAATAYLKILAREVAADGITVNTVLPGAFKTERYIQLIDSIARQSGRPADQVEQEILAKLPQRRFQKPEELAALVAFLASEQASAITGAAIPVDGGALQGLLS
jgi:3-oxoacyl-[acyl-carrier protein] reductase